MQPAAEPAAVADRAERHVFARLPGLPAIERRVLALIELAGSDRAGAARDTGLEAEALREVAARARKALRRARSPLPSGGRCERAELLLCDRLDGAIDRPGASWLDIHLDRCPRCREHEDLLAAARAELRAGFAAAESERAAPPPPPRTSRSGRHDVQKWTFAEKEAEDAGPPATGPDRARLRVVPAAPELPPAGEPELLPPAEPPAQLDPPPAESELPATEEPASLAAPPPEPESRPAGEPPRAVASPPAKRAAAPPAAPAPTTSRAPVLRRVARIAAIALLVAAVLVAIAFGLGSLGGNDTNVRAPWDQPGAPDVHPAPLSRQ